MFVTTAALLLALLPQYSDSARILALFPYNARSHFVVMSPLLQALAERGHDLTVVSSFPRDSAKSKSLKNYRDIDLSSYLPPVISNYTLEGIQESLPHLFKSALFIVDIHTRVCEKVLRDDRVVALLGEKFDLVIGEIFGSDCFNYLQHKVGAPLVSWVTSTPLPWMSDRAGLPDNPSYIPNYFVDFSPHMSLWERLFNALTLVYAKAAYYWCSELPARRLAQEALGGSLPPMGEVNERTALVLLNSHYSLSQSRPLPPNVVEVGGIHITEPKPLPKDLKDLLDSAQEGAVVVSFGSLVRVSSLPRPLIGMLLRVFASLPQRVIFKYEDDLPDAPPNVYFRKWLPQSDLIAHPNVVAVVTHGGLASTVEAVHYGKPLVGVPFFSDQFQNVRSVTRRGAGLMLDIHGLTEVDLHKALTAVVTDPRYTDNMRKLSLQFRDRPMTALQSAVYWTEYVIRHQGAPHLRPASVNLPLYQYLLLDVIAVLLLAVSLLVMTIYYTFRYLFCLANREKRKHTTKRKINNNKKAN